MAATSRSCSCGTTLASFLLAVAALTYTTSGVPCLPRDWSRCLPRPMLKQQRSGVPEVGRMLEPPDRSREEVGHLAAAVRPLEPRGPARRGTFPCSPAMVESIPGLGALGSLGHVGGAVPRTTGGTRDDRPQERVDDEDAGVRLDPPEAHLDDARTLAVAYDPSGQRHRDFRIAVPLLMQDAWPDFPVRGPRTTLWVLRFMSEQGTTPRGWHQKWRTEMRLQLSDQGVSLHKLSCEFLEHLVCFDQTNAPNLAAAEAASRQLQLVEERWRERAIGSSDGLDHQDIAVFSGRATRGNLCICLALEEWVAAELQKEYAVSKERRKAREERALARPKAAGKSANS